MPTVYLSTAYLPNVEYFSKLSRYERVYIEQYDHYAKQTYRNRCAIAGPNGKLILSIPVEKPLTPKCLVKDIRISNHGNWRHLHWNAIVSAYNNTPFFDFYKDEFRVFYDKHYIFLIDLNQAITNWICTQIGISPQIKFTDCYKTDFPDDEKDFRDVIHPKRDFHLWDPSFKSMPYYQVFSPQLGFLPNLSVIDLLFNMGPESLLVLQNSFQE